MSVVVVDFGLEVQESLSGLAAFSETLLGPREGCLILETEEA